ncbi:hypothetical protein [Allorhodopirellula solitaria]|uniref:Uncharacterized protein n=1 Tax=Allorhodopirellula solitaria TaxID=2527987 RepID=A0A5C5XTK6_9BACT|nr:hypothetical protein [Allorhodopirellula solitaria]TWT65355.1 hypothetical protein CA85_32670 [Allorhodopirellula solitaria]
MKPATISELKRALAPLSHDELLDACVRLAKFKVDNKLLLTYLTLKSGDEAGYVDEVCADIDEELPARGMIHKKTLRRIIRMMEKCIRFSGDKETELQIRIHFCCQISERGLQWGRCRVSENMYLAQRKKIEKALEKVHPDLQYDFRQQMQGLHRA